jgi:hypothetical protein
MSGRLFRLTASEADMFGRLLTASEADISGRLFT